MQRGLLAKLGLVIMAVFLSIAVAVVPPVNSAQAAVNSSPWLKSAGTSLADEFDTIIAHGGFSSAVGEATGGLTGVTGFHAAAGGASGILGAIGAGVELGLVVSTAGMKLAGKIHSGDWDEYTKNVNCNQAGKTMVAIANTGLGLLGFGDQYSCEVKADTSSFETIDKDGLVKAPVPEPAHVGLWQIDTPIYGLVTYLGQQNWGSWTSVKQSHFLLEKPYSNCNAQTQYIYATLASGQSFIDYIVPYLPGNTCSNTTDARGTTRHLQNGEDLSNIVSAKVCKDQSCTEFLDHSHDVSSADNVKRQISCRVTAMDGSHIDASGDSYTDSGGIPLDSAKWGCNNAWQQTLDAGKVPKLSLIHI